MLLNIFLYFHLLSVYTFFDEMSIEIPDPF